MTPPDCPDCDTATPLQPDGTDPHGVQRYFCSMCSHVSRFKDGRLLVPMREPDGICDAQGNWYQRED